MAPTPISGMIRHIALLAVLGVIYMAAAAPIVASASSDISPHDAPRVVVTTVCTIHADQLDQALTGMDLILGTNLGAHMPECEVTTEHLGPAPSVTVNIPTGALYPACAEGGGCFVPHTAKVDVGTEVVWTNRDTVLHTVTESGGAFDGWMRPGEEFAFTFDTPGTHIYGCTVHPWASGVVAVGPAPERRAPEPEPTASSGLAEAAMEAAMVLFEAHGPDAALARINAMAADPDPDVAVFVVDEGTGRIAAHSTLPAFLGLDMTAILDKAFIPAETVWKIIDSHKDDGVWLSYPVADPQGNIISYDRGLFKKHDGYVVVARYSTDPATAAQSVVYEMIRLYDHDPGNALNAISGFMSDLASYPFVLDPETGMVVAHGSDPARVGSVSVALTQADKPKGQILAELAGGGGTWVEYTFNNPATGTEDAKRSWLVMHDGHIFGSGYYGLEPEKVVGIVRDLVAMYDEHGASVFRTVNAMDSEGLYPFAIDAETLTVVAEGAFPQVVGLSATFLYDADPPLADILSGLESDGIWVDYAYSNPRTATYEDKRSYLTLHDGYIFGSGYYTSPDAGAIRSVNAMLLMYEALGDDALDDIGSVPTDTYNVPFVLDAATWEIVAHAIPDFEGDDFRDVINAGRSPNLVSDMLDRHGSLWISYPSADPAPGAEYTRAYMLQRDGYVFASGYGLGVDASLRSLVDEAVRLYEREGDAAFRTISSMSTTGQTVFDLRNNILVASSSSPAHRGLVVPPSAVILEQGFVDLLHEHSGVWYDRFLPSASGDSRKIGWAVMHDGYMFGASRAYTPEVATVSEVKAAMEMYYRYEEGAFDRITWQSIHPAAIYPFVFDAETWRTVAHAAYPDRLGMLPASIMADNDLDEISEALSENEGVWVSYKFYNPITNMVEHKRSWLALHDGYVFAAGHYYGNFDRAEGIVAEAIAGYDAIGEAAFDAINSEMSGSFGFTPIVLDRGTLNIVAHGGYPELVGQNISDISLDGGEVVADIMANLAEDGDFVVISSAMLDPKTGAVMPHNTIFRLYDGYVFAAAQPMAIYTYSAG